MKIKTLFLVHVEETFRHCFGGMFLRSILKGSGVYDEIIHFTSCIGDEYPIDELIPIIDMEITWGWGYEPEQFDEDNPDRQFVIAPKTFLGGHEWTWIPPELRNFDWENREIHLGGGCESECLADMESILSHLNVEYKRMEEMIY